MYFVFLFVQGFAKFSEIVKTHPIVRYFVADRPDMLGLRLFSESQKHIWIISGMCDFLMGGGAADGGDVGAGGGDYRNLSLD